MSWAEEYHKQSVAVANDYQMKKYGNNIWDRNSERHQEWLESYDKHLASCYGITKPKEGTSK